MSRLVAIDPGKSKCGLLLVDLDLDLVLDGKVVITNDVINIISFWKIHFAFDLVIMGNGTSSKDLINLLEDLCTIKLVNEEGSTLRSRERYWELWPPKNLLSFFPRGLLIPSQPLDAIAALILLEDHLHKKLNWPDKPNFRIET